MSENIFDSDKDSPINYSRIRRDTPCEHRVILYKEEWMLSDPIPLIYDIRCSNKTCSRLFPQYRQMIEDKYRKVPLYTQPLPFDAKKAD